MPTKMAKNYVSNGNDDLVCSGSWKKKVLRLSESWLKCCGLHLVATCGKEVIKKGNLKMTESSLLSSAISDQ